MYESTFATITILKPHGLQRLELCSPCGSTGPQWVCWLLLHLALDSDPYSGLFHVFSHPRMRLKESLNCGIICSHGREQKLEKADVHGQPF